MKIDVCSKKEQDYIIERLVEYNLSQVEAKQKENFIDLSKKIGKDDDIYCFSDNVWLGFDCKADDITVTVRQVGAIYSIYVNFGNFCSVYFGR